jgi:GNAT superfamily N-acetyltransferase
MIRRIGPTEAEYVFNLMGDVYANHSFLEQGLDSYQEQLSSGGYVSLGAFSEDGRLQAHAGYKVHPDFALINALAVDPDERGSGLGRAVFEARLDSIRSSGAFNFIVGYSMMQHLGSQKLYPDSFRPIGLDIGYPNIYHGSDAQYNRGDESNAEIVLCERLSSDDYAITVPLQPKDRDFARHIFDSLDVTCGFDDSVGEHGDEVFLGFHPDIERGLFIPTYLGRMAAVNFDPLLTSNHDREAFVSAIKEDHERETIR